MSMIIKFVVFSGVEILLEAVTWGTFGYIFFRFVGVNEKYWKWDYLLVLALFLGWGFWTNSFIATLGISIGNQEIMALLDNDINSLFEMDYLDIVIGAVEIFAGYRFGIFILEKLKRPTVVQ